MELHDYIYLGKRLWRELDLNIIRCKLEGRRVYNHILWPTHTEETTSAILALDSKEDTLTQTKVSDIQQFLCAQEHEIRGLETMNVFEYLPLQQLSSIMTYWWANKK
jgi:hypothetical protein